MVDLDHVQPGDTVHAQLSVQETQGIKPYADGHLLTLLLGNATGKIPAKLWLGPDAERARTLSNRYQPGAVLHIHANATEYRGRVELSLQEPPALVDPDTIDEAAFIPGPREHLGVLLRRTTARARRIHDPSLKALALAVWTDEAFQDDITQAPATMKNQRAHRGGLLERTAALLTLADATHDAYPRLDPDILATAILLHPLGVLDEHRVTTSIQITDPGRLLGPTLLTDARIQNLSPENPPDEERLLRVRHAMLALTASRGSNTVQPRTPEAIALAQIDQLDARLARTLEAAQRMEDEGLADGWAREVRQYLDLQARRPPSHDAQEPDPDEDTNPPAT